ncbi:hypothetical protein N7562_13425 [Acinetobacter soli]|uniref:hypothetical protein n=1 Tax=Acinetobacter soli TaxID=487316 RepID=UPI00287CDD14|nr:hypothetical protein [Acinetobacter soli]MDS7695175.1 hypothetical protein [Acinetobacter soli]
MIWINLRHKLPTDADLPADIRWTDVEWENWLNQSKLYMKIMGWYNDTNCIEARNKFIDQNSAHWGKLKPWLLTLSYGKCWFSEVRELYSHYDVEHFRPKKEAKTFDTSTRDGYWWLAFDYMNFRVCGNVGNRKKGGWFPLKEGSLCSTYSIPCEESESKYLLDPIDDDDVALIAFDEEGKVIPMPNLSEWEKSRVIETVKRLKLNEHTPLAEARRKVWQKANTLIDEFTVVKTRCSSGGNPAAKATLIQLRARFREMIDPKTELSSVARWCILLRNDIQLSRLLT